MSEDYSYDFFKRKLPDWKLKKEPLICRFFYRPISYYLSVFCAKCNISANSISYFSTIVGIISCFLFLPGSKILAILGSIGINFWAILDCVDGNLARCIKKQPFGEFADALSSYILVAFMCTSISFYVYLNGGLIIGKGCAWIILIGAFSSSGDTLMRLVYQKYKNSCVDMKKNGIVIQDNDYRLDNSKVRSLPVILEQYFGIGGYLPIFILFLVIIDSLDLIIYYCLFYYFGSFIFITLKYIFKTIKFVKNY